MSRCSEMYVIRNAPFISVVMDGSFDFLGEELETIYVRCSDHGDISDIFLALIHLRTQCWLKAPCNETIDYMGLAEAYSKKVIRLCADGVSNMQGRKSGLVAHLLVENPELTATRCLTIVLNFHSKISSRNKKCKQVRDLWQSHNIAYKALLLCQRSAKQKHVDYSIWSYRHSTNPSHSCWGLVGCPIFWRLCKFLSKAMRL